MLARLSVSTTDPTSLPRWVAPALLTLIVALFAVRNLPWHLDDYDQAKQAFTSWEMVHEGRWWFQHTPTANIATKPPLAGWISAALASAMGTGAWISWELAWRLPPFLCAIAILVILWKSGRRVGGELGAILAAGAFALNLFTPRLATLVRTDMMLTLFIFAAGFLVYEKLRTDRAWTPRDRWLLFAVVLASMLTKGPIAYAFLLPGLAAWCWLQRGRPDGATAWSGAWPWLGPLVFFAVWVGVGVWLSDDFREQVVGKEFLGRFDASEGAPHKPRPIYLYVTSVLHRFFPWSAALVALAFVPDVRAKLRRDRALLWLVCWALGGLIFMSLVPSKRADRIFPIIPPLCLLLAAMTALLPRAELRGWPLRRWVLVALGIALVFSGGYAAYEVITGYRRHQAALVDFGAKVRSLVPPEQLAVVSGKDEGMLLYTGKTRFTRLDDAVEQWRAGQWTALVLPVKALAARERELSPFRVLAESQETRGKSSRYACIVR